MTRGDLPGFRDARGEDYALVAPGSVGTPVALQPAIPLELLPSAQYVRHQQGRPRPEPRGPGALDL